MPSIASFLQQAEENLALLGARADASPWPTRRLRTFASPRRRSRDEEAAAVAAATATAAAAADRGGGWYGLETVVGGAGAGVTAGFGDGARDGSPRRRGDCVANSSESRNRSCGPLHSSTPRGALDAGIDNMESSSVVAGGADCAGGEGGAREAFTPAIIDSWVCRLDGAQAAVDGAMRQAEDRQTEALEQMDVQAKTILGLDRKVRGFDGRLRAVEASVAAAADLSASASASAAKALARQPEDVCRTTDASNVSGCPFNVQGPGSHRDDKSPPPKSQVVQQHTTISQHQQFQIQQMQQQQQQQLAELQRRVGALADCAKKDREAARQNTRRGAEGHVEELARNLQERFGGLTKELRKREDELTRIVHERLRSFTKELREHETRTTERAAEELQRHSDRLGQGLATELLRGPVIELVERRVHSAETALRGLVSAVETDMAGRFHEVRETQLAEAQRLDRLVQERVGDALSTDASVLFKSSGERGLRVSASGSSGGLLRRTVESEAKLQERTREEEQTYWGVVQGLEQRVCDLEGSSIGRRDDIDAEKASVLNRLAALERDTQRLRKARAAVMQDFTAQRHNLGARACSQLRIGDPDLGTHFYDATSPNRFGPEPGLYVSPRQPLGRGGQSLISSASPAGCNGNISAQQVESAGVPATVKAVAGRDLEVSSPLLTNRAVVGGASEARSVSSPQWSDTEGEKLRHRSRVILGVDNRRAGDVGVTPPKGGDGGDGGGGSLSLSRPSQRSVSNNSESSGGYRDSGGGGSSDGHKGNRGFMRALGAAVDLVGAADSGDANAGSFREDCDSNVESRRPCDKASFAANDTYHLGGEYGARHEEEEVDARISCGAADSFENTGQEKVSVGAQIVSFDSHHNVTKSAVRDEPTCEGLEELEETVGISKADAVKIARTDLLKVRSGRDNVVETTQLKHSEAQSCEETTEKPEDGVVKGGWEEYGVGRWQNIRKERVQERTEKEAEHQNEEQEEENREVQSVGRGPKCGSDLAETFPPEAETKVTSFDDTQRGVDIKCESSEGGAGGLGTLLSMNVTPCASASLASEIVEDRCKRPVNDVVVQPFVVSTERSSGRAGHSSGGNRSRGGGGESGNLRRGGENVGCCESSNTSSKQDSRPQTASQQKKAAPSEPPELWDEILAGLGDEVASVASSAPLELYVPSAGLRSSARTSGAAVPATGCYAPERPAALQEARDDEMDHQSAQVADVDAIVHVPPVIGGGTCEDAPARQNSESRVGAMSEGCDSGAVSFSYADDLPI